MYTYIVIKPAIEDALDSRAFNKHFSVLQVFEREKPLVKVDEYFVVVEYTDGVPSIWTHRDCIKELE